MVFVDPIQTCLKSKRWPYSKAAHLFVGVETPLDELHLFAKRIGLKREWFQYKPKSLPH